MSDTHPAAEEKTTPPRSVASAAGGLEKLVEDMEAAAHAWGVRPLHPEGQFMAVMKGAMVGLGTLVLAARDEIRGTITDAKSAAAAEVRTLHERNEQVGMTLRRLDAGQAALEIKRDKAVAEFVDKCSLLVAEKLGDVVVLRERGHHRKKAWKQVAAALTVLVASMAGAYAMGTRAHQADAAAVARCLERRVTDAKTGKGYCPIEAFLPNR